MGVVFGGLFDFESQESLDEFMSKMDKDTSIKIIELALLFVQKNGLFSFEESHIIYKCLEKIKKNENSILRNNPPNGDIT